MFIIRHLKQTPTKQQIERLGIAITNKSSDQYQQSYGGDSIGGARVPGLPVYLALSENEVTEKLRTRNYYKDGDGYVLVAKMADELFATGEAVIGKNKAFANHQGKQQYVRMEYIEGALRLPEGEEKYIDPDLIQNFEQDSRKLKNTTGEYYLATVPPVESYSLKIMRYGENDELSEVTVDTLPDEPTTEFNSEITKTHLSSKMH